MVRRPLRVELMDAPDLSPAEAERALDDIARTYRVAGHGALGRAVLPRLAGGRQRLVDIGTGSGEVAARLAGAARRRGTLLSVVGVDRHLRHLLIGRRRGFPQLRVVADARALPIADGAADWSVSTLFLHHFDAPDNRRILDEMRRVARRGAVVADLRRSWIGRWLTRLVLRLLPMGRVARHDGRVSVEQAWSLEEVRALAGDGELVELQRRWPFRFSLVLRPHARGEASGDDAVGAGLAPAREGTSPSPTGTD
jgi:ubiquinone/menaquinone biosynthesis C-methylase UbiE